MIHIQKRLVTIGIVLALAVFVGCRNNTPEAIDTADLVGHWELVANGETEWFDLAPGGIFKATISRDGFIATTLSQGPRVSIEGTWRLSDHTITFTFERSSEAALVDQSHSYQILKLTDRAMHTQDHRGNKKTLVRGNSGQNN